MARRGGRRSASSTSPPTAPTPTGWPSPTSQDRKALEASFKKDADTVAGGTHGGFDLLTDKTDKSVVAISDDTLLVGTSQAIVEAGIDRLAGTGDRLSDLQTFKDTLATLPTDNLAVGYAPGSVVQEARAARQEERSDRPVGSRHAEPVRQDLREARGRRPQLRLLVQRDRQGPPHPLDDALRRHAGEGRRAVLAGAARARPGELVVRGVQRAARRPDLEGASPRRPKTNADAQKQIGGAETMLGVKLDDVLALFSGETRSTPGRARRSPPALIMHPEDAEAGATTIRALTAC